MAFFKNWQSLVLSGAVPPEFKLKRSVLMYLASGLSASTAQLTAEIEIHELTKAEKVSEDWRESRMLFIEVAALKSRMKDLETMGMFLDKSLARYRKSRNPQKEIAKTLKGFDAAAASFSKIQKKAEKLLQPNGFEESLLAALYFDEDADALKSFFRDAKDTDAQALKEPGVSDSIVKTIDEVAASNNPVIEKARLLSAGMEQWRLGRYGIGPQGNGHLKAQLLVGAGQGGVIDHSLVMPEANTSTGEFPEEEGYERRHKYTWDLEERPLQTFSQFIPGTPSVCGSGGTPSETRTIRRFEPQDDSIPLRIVGTQEYRLALLNLDKLVANSSADELEVYDRVIGQLPEFVFYSGKAGGVKQPQPVAGANPIKNRAGSEFKKHSLAWAMALARVELNATRSMYIEGDDWFAPNPDQTFGVLEYYHVLLDDAAVHLDALKKDDEFKRAIKKSSKLASSKTMAYLRRLKLVDSMLVALEKSGAPLIAERASMFRKEVEEFTLTFEAQVALSTGGTSR